MSHSHACQDSAAVSQWWNGEVLMPCLSVEQEWQHGSDNGEVTGFLASSVSALVLWEEIQPQGKLTWDTAMAREGESPFLARLYLGDPKWDSRVVFQWYYTLYHSMRFS